jgi:hypothetical protein
MVGAGNNANVLQLRNIPTRNTVNGLRQLFADDAGNLVTFQMTTTANSASEVKLILIALIIPFGLVTNQVFEK